MAEPTVDWPTAAAGADLALDNDVRVLVWTAPRSRRRRAQLAWRLFQGVDRVGQVVIYYRAGDTPEGAHQHIALTGVLVDYDDG